MARDKRAEPIGRGAVVPSAAVRITVVSALAPAEATEALRDLGCAVREGSPLAPPEELADRTDVLVIEAGDDAEIGRFVLGRVRRLPRRLPVLLAVRTSQLTRLDPSWAWDDLALQPYVPQELYVRLRAVEWRASEFVQEERVKVGPLVIDPGAHEATLAGQNLDLAPQEFALLHHLALHRSKVHTRESLLREVWGLRGVESRTVDVHVRRLRAKLGAAVQIETVRGVGYKITATELHP